MVIAITKQAIKWDKRFSSINAELNSSGKVLRGRGSAPSMDEDCNKGTDAELLGRKRYAAWKQLCQLIENPSFQIKSFFNKKKALDGCFQHLVNDFPADWHDLISEAETEEFISDMVESCKSLIARSDSLRQHLKSFYEGVAESPTMFYENLGVGIFIPWKPGERKDIGFEWKIYQSDVNGWRWSENPEAKKIQMQRESAAHPFGWVKEPPAWEIRKIVFFIDVMTYGREVCGRSNPDLMEGWIEYCALCKSRGGWETRDAVDRQKEVFESLFGWKEPEIRPGGFKSLVET